MNSGKQAYKTYRKESMETKASFLNDKKRTISNQFVAEKKQETFDNFANNLTENQKQQALEQIKVVKARNNYIDYLKYVYPDFKETKFHRFLALICDTIVKRIEKANMPNATQEDIQKGRIKLLISTPPQHGKSITITKTLPSWFIGRNPKRRAILTAYNADLAEKFEDGNRQLTREYGKKLFGIEISEAQDNKQEYELKSGGGVKGAGIQGGITGNPADLIIIDDPYKNSVEANSPATRKLIEDTFRDSVYSRLSGFGSAIIVIQTRWHEQDLSGVLSKEKGWVVINIPCICDDEQHDPLKRKLGDPLCPELGKDYEWALQTKEVVGRKVWEALYQGHPSIDGGEIFTREMIKYYTKTTLPPNFEEITMSCDLSFGGIKKQNDPCAIQVWGRVGANHYLLKRIKKRYTFNEMCNTIKLVSASYPQLRRKIVEKKANGQAVIDSLNSVIGGFEAFDPKMVDKVGRANAITPLFESGNIFLPSKDIDDTIDEMVEEMMQFPNSDHDDEVDAMTQYLNSYSYKYSGKICTDNYYSELNRAFRGIKL